jgi:hypothetical protein
MTDQFSPITPPPELVQQWVQEVYGLEGVPGSAPGKLPLHIATQAAQWGADQELLACGNYLERCAAWEEEDVTEMYNYLRSKPPSLKEQALEELSLISISPESGVRVSALDTIRRALEQLDD